MVRHPPINFLRSQTEWVKFGIVRNMCFVGRETVAVGDGCYIIFYNLQTKDETIFTAGDDEKGLGIKCVAGHKVLSVFGFGELGAHARVHVLTCPDFHKISVMTGGTEDGFLCIAFSESEFLITLNDLPHFACTVWNWRNGEKIVQQATDIHSPKQVLRCSFGSPVYMAQVGIHTNQVSIWDMLMCGKRCLLTEHKVIPVRPEQHFTSVQWTSDSSLFIMDSTGDIYLMTPDYRLELSIKWSNIGPHNTLFTWYKGGLVATGPDLKLRHYKKSGGWTCDWTATCQFGFIRLASSPRDFLAGVSESGDIMVYDHHIQEFKYVKEHETVFDDMCMLYPTGEYMVTLSRSEEITVWRVATGITVDSMTLGGPALAMAEHPEYPYFAIAFGHGMLQLFSFYETNTIKLLTSFHLTRNSLSSVSFAESGKLIVVADMSIGEFFVIEGKPGTKMHVVATCCANRQIADYILVASRTCFRLFALNVTSNEYISGNIITRFCIVRGRPCPDQKDYQTEQFDTLYSRLYPTKLPTRDRLFYAQPTNSKFLHELEVKRGDMFARLVKKIPSKHQMRKIIYHFDEHHIASFGYDGLVCIQKGNFEYQGCVMPHHRMDAGIVEAYVDPLGKHIVALGRNNSLVCLTLRDVKIDKDKEKALHELLTGPKAFLMFKQPTFGFLPKGEHAGKTWLEVEDFKVFGDEYKKCEQLKNSILRRYKNVKKQIKQLLTKNLEGPENEYLEIQQFNLDTELMESKMLENVQKCKETEIYLKELILAQDKISAWIKQYCWDTMEIQGKTIYGIFSAIDVESYSLLPADFHLLEVMGFIEQYRDVEGMMAKADIFEPWLPRTTNELKTLLSKVPSVQKEAEEKIVTLEEIEQDDEDKDKELNEEDQYPNKETITALAGSTAHLFITLESGHYEQQQIQSYLQAEYQLIFSKNEKIKLKQYFNKEFENLMTLKVRDINNILDRNKRLRHIISEINFFSTNKLNIIIIDPEWNQNENPLEILDVKDNELTVTPYISPSQQAILDAEAAEKERLRLLMLADDFKDRALMVMMNGVLEVRWEDELKKDVPLPKCMLEKRPEDFKEEDLRAIRDYEEKVKFLESERIRYKRMLCAEYGQVSNTIRENVKKFNSRVDELLQLKIKVQSAVDQECLRIHRLRLKNYQKIMNDEREKEVLKSIGQNEKEIEALQKRISSLSEDLSECRNVMESLQTKEKLVEKSFRRDMQEASPAAQEISQKLYKRRPKTNIRLITSITVMQELSRCVITKERTYILTQEALDFLKAMDALDMYVGVPNAVDEHLYAIVCKNRRLKIESEIKIKAATLDIADADATVATLHKMLSQKKENAHKLTSDLAQIRLDKLKLAENIELQLVIKQGFVETSLSGEIKDFDDAILISRKDIEDINAVILKGGNKKLKSMREAMTFRRGILAMEWGHRKMKMQIEDLMNYIKDIKAVKVTKEMQAYLKAQARGASPDKGLAFEPEVELVKQSYQKIIDERKANVKDLQIRIDAVTKNTKALDKQVSDINVDVCEQKLNVDIAIIHKEKELVKSRTDSLLKRAKLVKQIQANHNEILVLQTELELLRLKTYPTLKYKIFT